MLVFGAMSFFAISSAFGISQREPYSSLPCRRIQSCWRTWSTMRCQAGFVSKCVIWGMIKASQTTWPRRSHFTALRPWWRLLERVCWVRCNRHSQMMHSGWSWPKAFMTAFRRALPNHNPFLGKDWFQLLPEFVVFCFSLMWDSVYVSVAALLGFRFRAMFPRMSRPSHELWMMQSWKGKFSERKRAVSS